MVRLIVSILALILIALFAWGVSWFDRAYELDLRPRPGRSLTMVPYRPFHSVRWYWQVFTQ